MILCFAIEDFSTMLDDLSSVRNTDKTKVMSNALIVPASLKVGGSTVEVVDVYVYLGQTVQLGRSNFEKVGNHRI